MTFNFERKWNFNQGNRMVTLEDLEDFSRERPFDPRDFGAKGDGVTDDTAAIQAALNAVGSGTVELPPLTFKISGPLLIPTGVELRGTSMKSSILALTADVVALRMIGGQSQAVRNLRISNTFTGARTNYDVEVFNPTKPVFEDFEIELPDTATAKGGIYMARDVGQAGNNSFMPNLSRVWLRNCRLVCNNVTDGHWVDGYVWAHNTAAAAAIDFSNVCDGWTFASVDVVPAIGGAGYKFANTNHIKIVGGYLDGSYDAILTGHGIHAVNSGRIFVTGTNFYNLGRSGIVLDNTHGCVFSSAGFYRNNKSDGSYPDIDLINSTYNTFIGLSHSQPVNRTNKGEIYREDAASVQNLYDASTLDQSLGNLYKTPLFAGNAYTLGKRNRPPSLWPKPAGVPSIIVPPATQFAIGSTVAWPAANRAYFHRFNVVDGAVYRYARLRVDAGSGNMQVSVVSLDSSGLNYTRVMNSGIIACASGGQAVDMGATYLAPGAYALAIWVDNAVATFPLMNGGEPVRASQLTAEVDIAGGVPASGALTYSCTRALSAMILTA